MPDGGTDSIDNVAAICPNCHRKMHVLNEEKDIIILQKVAKEKGKMLARLLFYETNLISSFYGLFLVYNKIR